MVLCRQIIPGADCGDDYFENRDSIKRSVADMPCDCVPIVGRDHLTMKRARKFHCKSKRIKHLALPKTCNVKYCDEPAILGKPSVEIIRTEEEQTPVRVKLLAYPTVNKLLSSREAYKKTVDKEWLKRFEELIQRSKMTLYSSLANVQFPEKSPCKKKWTRADWQCHCEWLKKRALPKDEKKPPPVKRKKVPLSNLEESIIVLSRPRQPRLKYLKHYGYVSTVKYAAKIYEPTERIYKLAEPKHPKFEDEEEVFEPFQVKPRALSSKPTKRIKELATPRPLPPPPADKSDFTSFGVLKRALVAKSSQRTLDLSKPKIKNDEDEDEEDKPLVNPKALKAKPTPRVLKLAEPRLPIATKYKF